MVFVMLIFIFLLLLFFICRCFLFTFSFPHHPSPFRRLSPGIKTYFVLSAQPIAELFMTLLLFNRSVIFLPRVPPFWVGIFYPQAFFTLHSFPTFWYNLLYQGFTGSRQLLSWKLQGFILILETQTQPICLFDSQ